MNPIMTSHRHNNLRRKLGFSMKFKAGEDATILSPSGATQFTYRLSRNLNENELAQVESLHEVRKNGKKSYAIRKILKQLKVWGVKLEYKAIDHPVASANFQMLDCCLPEVLSQMLLYWFEDGDKKLPELSARLSEENPLKLPTEVIPEIYEYKLKKLLCEVALGMKPATVWDGKYDATGGFIVIEENGGIVCYHLIQRNMLEDYLFQNTYLDTPSSSKHSSYGGVYEKGGSHEIKLTLQIRFHDRLKI